MVRRAGLLLGAVLALAYADGAAVGEDAAVDVAAIDEARPVKSSEEEPSGNEKEPPVVEEPVAELDNSSSRPSHQDDNRRDLKRNRRNELLAQTVSALTLGLLYYIAVSKKAMDAAHAEKPDLKYFARYMLALKNHPVEMSVDLGLTLAPIVLGLATLFNELSDGKRRKARHRRRKTHKDEDDGDDAQDE